MEQVDQMLQEIKWDGKMQVAHQANLLVVALAAHLGCIMAKDKQVQRLKGQLDTVQVTQALLLEARPHKVNDQQAQILEVHLERCMGQLDTVQVRQALLEAYLVPNKVQQEV